ncbi:MAG: O-antigen ligase family protein [Bacteroidota bacterium]
MSERSLWSFEPGVRVDVQRRPGDVWIAVLAVLLFLYAFVGKSAAYIGVPPLFIGEVVLASGLAVSLLARRPQTYFVIPAMWVSVLLMAWVAIRTLPYIGEFGFDAPRDAMIAGYILFAFLTAGFIMERPERLRWLMEKYRILVVAVCAATWLVYLVYRINPEIFPILAWSGNDTRMMEHKPGDLLVHLAGITCFLVLRFKKPTPLLLALLIVGTAAMMVGNRGGMLGYVLAMALFAVLKPRGATFGKLAYVGAFLIILGLLVDTNSIKVNEGNRNLSVEQIWENVRSIFGSSDDRVLNDTVEWRTTWWTRIVNYTFFGEYRWHGKGFGRNIATEDGFRVDQQGSLRSPHNATMTMLARGGVTGASLWLLVHALWFWSMLRGWFTAKTRGLREWQGFFATCMAFWLAAHVNSSFDVYLEGPMGAIWFWSVAGLAAAGTKLIETHPDLLDGLIEGLDDTAPPASGATWGWSSGDGAATAPPSASVPPAAVPRWTSMSP